MASALELGAESLDGELRLAVSILASLERRIRNLERIEALARDRAR